MLSCKNKIENTIFTRHYNFCFFDSPDYDVILCARAVAGLRHLHLLELVQVHLPVVEGDGVKELDVAHDVGAGLPLPGQVQGPHPVVHQACHHAQEGLLHAAQQLIPLASYLDARLAVEHCHVPP